MKEIHIISLGAGVQSSAMALMAACGELAPMPVAAIFADTQAEPASVYKWLDWLETQLPFPVRRISKGNLTEVATTLRTRKDGKGTWVKSIVPTFMKNANGSTGTLQRQCTYDYKVLPLQREALKIMKEHGADSVVQWIGISLDEVRRMRQTTKPRITNRWPLVSAEMRRADCLRWMASHGFPEPPRSACIYCPYHSNKEWRRLKDNEPAEFQKAVEFERAIQALKEKTDNQKAIPFLHRSLVPLDQIDLSTDLERGQGDLFENDCQGMCGL